jgi:hypothetical protein
METGVPSPVFHLGMLVMDPVFRDDFIDSLDVWFRLSRGNLSTIKAVLGNIGTFAPHLHKIELKDNFAVTELLFTTSHNPQTVRDAMIDSRSALSRLPNANLLRRAFDEELQRMKHGRAVDSDWARARCLPTARDCFLMIDDICGGFVRLCARLMMLCSMQRVDYLEVENHLDLLTRHLARFMALRWEGHACVPGSSSYWEAVEKGKVTIHVTQTLARSISRDQTKVIDAWVRRPRGWHDTVKDQMVAYDTFGKISELLEYMQSGFAAETRAIDQLMGKRNKKMRDFFENWRVHGFREYIEQGKPKPIELSQ